MDNSKTGEFITKLRVKKDLSKQELAKKLNITVLTLTSWENGTKVPDVSLIDDLADELDCDVSELINGKENKDKSYSAKEANKMIRKAVYLSKIKRETEHEKAVGITFLVYMLFLALYLFLYVSDLFPKTTCSFWESQIYAFIALPSLLYIYLTSLPKLKKKADYITIAYFFYMILYEIFFVCYIYSSLSYITQLFAFLLVLDVIVYMIILRLGNTRDKHFVKVINFIVVSIIIVLSWIYILSSLIEYKYDFLSTNLLNNGQFIWFLLNNVIFYALVFQIFNINCPRNKK